ncbi:MAG: transketolase [Ruminococcaceae bacterium]|nr:transketolase [Oscillospiraceae bacterium]
MTESRKNELTRIAYEIRRGALDAVYSAASGHPGGSLSIADILAYLYFEEMNIDPADPKKADRDRFVLSKGHASPAIYSTLAHRGFFPVEDLKTFRQVDSVLQGHPDMKHIPGIDMTTGSLGLGISAACGMALGAKLNGIGNRVWAIVGDGESEEGQVWEAAMFAAHYKLDNLAVFVDWNGLQIDGPVAEVMNPTPLDEKFKAFGWNVVSIDAHDLDAIEAAVALAKATKGKPTAIIAKSVKGKGVSYMENNVAWHGAAPKADQYEIGCAELDAVIGG